MAIYIKISKKCFKNSNSDQYFCHNQLQTIYFVQLSNVKFPARAKEKKSSVTACDIINDLQLDCFEFMINILDVK